MNKNYLNYSLDTGVDRELKFQIQEQSPLVDRFFDFLETLGKDGYMTKVGYKIKRGAYPEFKITTNTIYLRGYLKSQYRKVDVTPSYSNYYRKGTVKMFEKAMDEFVNEVRKADEAGFLGGYPSFSILGGCPDVRTGIRLVNPLAGLNEKARPSFTPSPIEVFMASQWAYTDPTPKTEVIYITL